MGGGGLACERLGGEGGGRRYGHVVELHIVLDKIEIKYFNRLTSLSARRPEY